MVSVARVIPNSAFRPRNFSFAKAKPAIVQKNTVAAVTTSATTSERPSAWKRSAWASASPMFLNSPGPGSSGGDPS